MDSAPCVIRAAVLSKLGLAMLLNPEALQLNNRLTSKGIDPKADNA